MFRGNRLSSLECGVREAFVIEELRLLEKRRESDSGDTASLELNLYHSGIPPPILGASALPSEPQHAA